MNSPTISDGIEQENGYYFVGQTSLSILKVVDCLKNGLSFDDVQRIFRLTDQEVADTKAFLTKNSVELEHQHYHDIERFKKDMLLKLEGVHTPSRKQRSIGLSGLLIGLCLLYGAILTFNDPISRIILTPLAFLFVTAGIVMVYIQFRIVHKFQSHILFTSNGFKRGTHTVFYDSIQRIKISPIEKSGRFLYIQNTSQYWLPLICTDSMNEAIEELGEQGHYDPVLHFELPEEQTPKVKRL